jgi:uncharacterized protein with HEPN domain
MKKRSQRLYLSDIHSSMMKIRSYIFGMAEEEFIANQLVFDAVIRNFEIIGEAAGHLASTFTEAHPDVPWKSMIGLRNIAIHGYFHVDPNIVWIIATRDLPQSLAHIQTLIDSAEID